MSLPEPKKGISQEFHIFNTIESEITLGNPEKIVWSSIRHLCSVDVADSMLKNQHGIRSNRTRVSIARNLKTYIVHAYDFYRCAEQASTTTAPLLYYYSFLNLAKAVCEIKNPRFHKKDESYRHGVSWKPSKDYTVYMPSEIVRVTTRGVWHVLWESITGRTCRIPNPTDLRVKDLFSYCVGTSIEYIRSFGEPARTVSLINPEILYDSDSNEVWLNFSVNKDDFKELKLSRPAFLKMISDSQNAYRQVRSDDEELWKFELAPPKRIHPNYKGLLFDLVRDAIRIMNVYVHPDYEELAFYIPDQRRQPIKLSNIVVLYTILFWLGSIVRYDPHSVFELQDSQYWLAIDGFLTQSRVWLLELFEWELYQTETYLKSVR